MSRADSHTEPNAMAHMCELGLSSASTLVMIILVAVLWNDCGALPALAPVALTWFLIMLLQRVVRSVCGIGFACEHRVKSPWVRLGLLLMFLAEITMFVWLLAIILPTLGDRFGDGGSDCDGWIYTPVALFVLVALVQKVCFAVYVTLTYDASDAR